MHLQPWLLTVAARGFFFSCFLQIVVQILYCGPAHPGTHSPDLRRAMAEQAQMGQSQLLPLTELR